MKMLRTIFQLRALIIVLTISLLPAAFITQITSLVEAQTKGRGLGLQTGGSVGTWPASTKRFALIIGVDRYADTQITTLGGAANDAKTLSDALVRYAGFPADQVISLASDEPAERQPTRGNILRRLSNLASAVPKDGLLVVSFAGHGIERGGQAFLLPSDAQVSNDVDLLEQTAINVKQVKERIQRTGVGQVMLLLDACRNDPAGRSDTDNPLTPAFTRGLGFDMRNREITAFATLYATAVGQRAYEYREKKQGYFTWAVVEGLKGAAANGRGEVTLSELIKYVQEQVPKRVRLDLGAGKDQRPFAVVEGYKADELIVAASASQRPLDAATTTAASLPTDSTAASATSSESSSGATARSIEGTVWTGSGGNEDGEYTVVFLKGGMLRLKTLGEEWTVGTWNLTRNSIFFVVEEFSLRRRSDANASMWEGNIQGSLMRGEAANKSNAKWRWYLNRKETAQPADLNATSVKGTTWTGTSTSGEEKFTVEFLDDGKLRYKLGEGDAVDGTWKQAGVTVRFVVNQFSVWQGNLEGRTMKGAFYRLESPSNARGSWSANREGR